MRAGGECPARNSPTGGNRPRRERFFLSSGRPATPSYSYSRTTLADAGRISAPRGKPQRHLSRARFPRVLGQCGRLPCRGCRWQCLPGHDVGIRRGGGRTLSSSCRTGRAGTSRQTPARHGGCSSIRGQGCAVRADRTDGSSRGRSCHSRPEWSRRGRSPP